MRVLIVDDEQAFAEPLAQRLELRGIEAAVAGDAETALGMLSRQEWDLVFLDVPCSNTGVPRRRPDALWRFCTARLKEITELQKQILNAQIRLVRPGGHLLYSTCSIEPEEDRLQISAFLSAHPDCEPVAMRLLTPSATHDGAFAALLRKKQK